MDIFKQLPTGVFQMKFKKLFSLSTLWQMFNANILLSVFLLQACVSTTYTRRTTEHPMSEDNIIAFATVKEKSGDIPKDSIVMLGEKFNYVILSNKDRNKYYMKDMNKVLNVDLPKQFEIEKKSEDVVIWEDTFRSEIHLKYQCETNAEKEKLEQIGFREIDQERGSCLYRKYFSVEGKIYKVNPQQVIPADYRFQKPIPIKLALETRQYERKVDTDIIAALPLAPVMLLTPVGIASMGLAIITTVTGEH